MMDDVRIYFDLMRLYADYATAVDTGNWDAWID